MVHIDLSGEIDSRRKFYNIERPSVRARIVRMGGIVNDRIPHFVATAFEAAAGLQGIDAAMGGSREAMIDLLIRHFRILLSARGDEELEQSYNDILGTMQRNGQDIRLFISISAIVLRSVLKAGVSKLFWRPYEFAKCMMAMGSVYSFDVSVALHLQVELDRAVLDDRSRLLDREVAAFRGEMSEVLSSVDQLTAHLSDVSAAVDQAVADIASRTDHAVGSISGTVDAMEASSSSLRELEGTIEDTSGRAQSGASLAHSAVERVRKSGDVLGGLSGALQEVDNITEMISAVAAQTNLLALNATIESARAGAAGRGFAIVASEVKVLAGQSEKAAEEIKSIIARIQEAALAVTDENGVVAFTIDQLSETTSAVSDVVQHQREAVQNIRRQVDAVFRNARAIQDNVAAVVQSSESGVEVTRSLVGIAAGLKERSASLNHRFNELARRLQAS